MELNLGDEKFIQGLLAGKTMSGAYRESFCTEGMDNKAISRRASALYKKERIQKKYTELKEKLAKEAEEEAVVSAKEILKELVKIGFAEISDFAYVEGELVRVLSTEEVDRDKLGAVASVKQGTKGVEVKLYDKLRALDMIIKILGIYTEREVSVDNCNSIEEYLKKCGGKYEY